MDPKIPSRVLTAICMLMLVGCSGAASSSEAPAASPSPEASPSAVTLVAARCDPSPKAFDPAKIDLTGPWAGDDDGIYYLRQLDSVVWWNGMSNRKGSPENFGREWNNVGRGEIALDLTIAVSWADVPRGGILGGGTMTLRIEDDGTGNVRLTKIAQATGDFGNNVWTPCKPG